MKKRRRAAPRKRKRAPAPAAPDPATELAHLSLLLAAEPDLIRSLEHVLTTSRRLTRAEAGTVYLRRGDNLEFAVVQNDVLARRVGEQEVHRRVAARPLPLREPSIASYVVHTRCTVNLPDAYAIPRDRPYALFHQVDSKAAYTTRSMLATPLRNAQGRVFGVLQLMNARDGRKSVRAFSKEHQALVLTLAALAANVPAEAATS